MRPTEPNGAWMQRFISLVFIPFLIAVASTLTVTVATSIAYAQLTDEEMRGVCRKVLSEPGKYLPEAVRVCAEMLGTEGSSGSSSSAWFWILVIALLLAGAWGYFRATGASRRHEEFDRGVHARMQPEISSSIVADDWESSSQSGETIKPSIAKGTNGEKSPWNKKRDLVVASVVVTIALAFVFLHSTFLTPTQVGTPGPDATSQVSRAGKPGVAVSPATLEQGPATRTLVLVPGESIGPLKLGMTEAQVIKALGNPKEITDPGQVAWNLAFDRHSVFAVFYHLKGRNPGGKLISITTHSKGILTANGSGVGSSRTDLARLMGAPVSQSSEGNEAIWYYPGIWFGLGGSVVEAVTVVPREAGATILPYILDMAAKDKGIASFRSVNDGQERISYIASLLRPEKNRNPGAAHKPLQITITGISFESGLLTVKGTVSNPSPVAVPKPVLMLLIYDCGAAGKCQPGEMVQVGREDGTKLAGPFSSRTFRIRSPSSGNVIGLAILPAQNTRLSAKSEITG